MLKKGFFVTGTDTGVGKTIVSLGLCLHFKASYWKPIQTGTPGDADFIKKFLSSDKIHSDSYSFTSPVSPNQAARKKKTRIDLKKIIVPKSHFLIVEGIGGVFVPLNSKQNVMDLIKLVCLPVIVVARSGLGTLNHSLLTLEALRKRKLHVAGVVLSGKKHPENKKDVEQWGKSKVLLQIPLLKSINKKNLIRVFKKLKV